MLSHIVTIKTEVRDHAAVSAACRRLELPPPVLGTAQLFEGSDTAVSRTGPAGCHQGNRLVGHARWDRTARPA